MTKRILVVDDHDVVRQGVRLILRKHSEWQVVGEAENGTEAVEKARSLDPDLMILDISMPGKDGLEVIADLTRLKARSKILVLTMHDSKELTEAVEKSGASGYLLKTHAARDLVQAMSKIFEGGNFFPTDLSTSPKPATEKDRNKGGMFRLTLALAGTA